MTEYQTIYDDMILDRLDPLFRRLQVALLNDQLRCRFNVEEDTVEKILSSFKSDEAELKNLHEDFTDKFHVNIALKFFRASTLRAIISQMVMHWEAWDNPILMYPHKVRLLKHTNELISGERTSVMGSPMPMYQFKISANMFKWMQQLRDWSKSSYHTLASADFIGYWNMHVVDELKLDDSAVWRFVELGGLMKMLGNTVADYSNPMPGTDLDAPTIPCSATYKQDKLQFLTIGNYQLLKHHPQIENNLAWQRRNDGSKERFIG